MKPLVQFALAIALLQLVAACGEASLGAESDRDLGLVSPGSGESVCERDADCDDGSVRDGREQCRGAECMRMPLVSCSDDVCEFVEAGRAAGVEGDASKE